MYILLHWDYIKEVIINDDKIAQKIAKENLFFVPEITKTDKTDKTDQKISSFSADGVLCRNVPVPIMRPTHHTVWYNLMIVVDFMIYHKKSIIMSFVAIGLYFIMF